MVAFLAASCAEVDPARFAERNNALLETVVRKTEENASRPKLYYLGLALYSEPWSENDVVELGARLQTARGYAFAPIVLSNRVYSLQQEYPAATPEAMKAAVAHIGSRYRPGDLVVVALSSHGNKGLVVTKMNGKDLGIAAPQLAILLRQLEAARTVVILSACHSGSLVDALRGDNRAIFTAAREDRPSFGCAPTSTNTLFGQTLLENMNGRNKSLAAVFAATVAGIERKEKAGGVLASHPQIVVGSGMTEVMAAELF